MQDRNIGSNPVGDANAISMLQDARSRFERLRSRIGATSFLRALSSNLTTFRKCSCER